ncbi:MAG: thiosulfate oxidation carrier protein SoxY [Betaproteobacteria bacterium]|nr:thiosulfate oxidation carrier protein SoxY [Betaproteobacteria bacterium]
MQVTPHSPKRRALVSGLARLGIWVGAGTLSLLRPLWAVVWNQAAFETMKIDAAIQAAGIRQAQLSDDILINAPEIAENGAQVPIDVTSRIPGTEHIYIFADKNVQPYVADFVIGKGLEPYVATRIKMGETSPLRVYVLAGGRYFYATREVQVTIGGCAS